MKNCPFCAETIKDEALKCKHCGEMISSKELELEEEERKISLEDELNSNWSIEEKGAYFCLGSENLGMKEIMIPYIYSKTRSNLGEPLKNLTSYEKSWRKVYKNYGKILKDFPKENVDTILSGVDETKSIRTLEKIIKFSQKKYGKDYKPHDMDFGDWLDKVVVPEYIEEGEYFFTEGSGEINHLLNILDSRVGGFIDSYLNNESIEKLDNTISSEHSEKKEVKDASMKVLSAIKGVEDIIFEDTFQHILDVGYKIFDFETSLATIEKGSSWKLLREYIELAEKFYLNTIVRLNCVKSRLDWDKERIEIILKNDGDNSIKFDKDFIEPLIKTSSYLSLFGERGVILSNRLYNKTKEINGENPDYSNDKMAGSNGIGKIKYIILYLSYLILYFLLYEFIIANFSVNEILELILFLGGFYFPYYVISKYHK